MIERIYNGLKTLLLYCVKKYASTVKVYKLEISYNILVKYLLWLYKR